MVTYARIINLVIFLKNRQENKPYIVTIGAFNMFFISTIIINPLFFTSKDP